MIHKLTLVQLIQARLNGAGGSPSDVRGVYHPRTIETHVGIVIDDLISDNPTMAEAMALSMDVDITHCAPFTGTLPYSVIVPRGVYSINSNNKIYSIVTPYDFVTMQRYNPSILLAKIEKKVITLSQQPDEEEGVGKIQVLAIPNFRDLPQDAAVILEQHQTKLADMVVQRLQSQQMQEKNNDSVRDGSQQRQNR